jgi:hypothetical protein
VRYLEIVGLLKRAFAKEEAIVAVSAETVAGRRETPEALAARALAIVAAEPALLKTCWMMGDHPRPTRAGFVAMALIITPPCGRAS